MKKSRILAAAMASIAITGALSGCTFGPEDNDEPDVYGPPLPYEEPEEENEASQDEPPEADSSAGDAEAGN